MVFGNMAGSVITVLLWQFVMTLAWPSVPGSTRFVSSFLNGLASCRGSAAHGMPKRSRSRCGAPPDHTCMVAARNRSGI